MKKIFTIICITFVILFATGVNVSADTGPKPNLTLNISGLNVPYTVALAEPREDVWGPQWTYDPDAESGSGQTDGEHFNEIMTYEDSDNFVWITLFETYTTDATFTYSYHAPDVFKILIMIDGDSTIYSSAAIERKEFSATYDVVIDPANPANMVITNVSESSFWGNGYGIVIRIFVTLALEIAILFIYKMASKRNLIVAIITNIATQFGLNILLNVIASAYFASAALLLFIPLEIAVALIEFAVYFLGMKESKKKIFYYTLTANIISMVFGFILWILI